jgi:alpha-glucoside transport system permease protein
MTTATDTQAAIEPSVEKESRWSRGPIYLVVSLIAALWTIPSLGLLLNSFRAAQSARGSGWWTLLSTEGGWWKIWTIPGHFLDTANWTLGNYRQVLSGEGFGGAFANSLAVTIPAVVIPITIAAFAAYAFSWMRFPGRQVLFALVVGLMVVPLQMALIPILKVYQTFNVTGTFPAIWLAHAGFGLPLAVYLLRNYIGSLPSSLMESASIDGADHFTIFWRLVVPLSVPVLAAFAIFQFLWVWNDYLIALIFLGSDLPVLTFQLAQLNGRGEGALSLLPAAAFITMVLPMVVFFSLQRFFVRGLTAGSVKG